MLKSFKFARQITSNQILNNNRNTRHVMATMMSTTGVTSTPVQGTTTTQPEHKLVQLVKNDHTNIRNVYQSFQNEKDNSEKQKFGNELIRLMSVHTSLEELSLYPAIEKHYPGGKAEVDRDRHDHLIMKEQLSKFDTMSSELKEYDTLAQDIMTNFNRHAEHEEKDVLPNLHSYISPTMMDEIHDNMESMRQTAPTRPHPNVSDTGGAAQRAAAAMSAPIDKLRDTGKEFPKET